MSITLNTILLFLISGDIPVGGASDPRQIGQDRIPYHQITTRGDHLQGSKVTIFGSQK